ncbi:MAG: hypothetical protein MZV70_52670 [Desulfobacterales bacterium]|nr:hypothetical protein [Desulfobacterales bacterium]
MAAVVRGGLSRRYRRKGRRSPTRSPARSSPARSPFRSAADLVDGIEIVPESADRPGHGLRPRAPRQRWSRAPPRLPFAALLHPPADMAGQDGRRRRQRGQCRGRALPCRHRSRALEPAAIPVLRSGLGTWTKMRAAGHEQQSALVRRPAGSSASLVPPAAGRNDPPAAGVRPGPMSSASSNRWIRRRPTRSGGASSRPLPTPASATARDIVVTTRIANNDIAEVQRIAQRARRRPDRPGHAPCRPRPSRRPSSASRRRRRIVFCAVAVPVSRRRGPVGRRTISPTSPGGGLHGPHPPDDGPHPGGHSRKPDARRLALDAPRRSTRNTTWTWPGSRGLGTRLRRWSPSP